MKRKLKPNDPEYGYTSFLITENVHQEYEVTLPPSVGTVVKYNNKNGPPPKAKERERVGKMIARLILRRAPMITRIDEIRDLVKTVICDKITPVMMYSYLDEARRRLSRTAGLTLFDVRLSTGKRELFLRQILAFPFHDSKVTNEADHHFRGFLLMLAPCLRAYINGMPLDCLFQLMRSFGKGYMLPKSSEEERSLATQLRLNRKKEQVKSRVSSFTSLADYILYARDMGYVKVQEDQERGIGIGSVLILPGYRYFLEFDRRSYAERMKQLNIPSNIKRNIDFLFSN